MAEREAAAAVVGAAGGAALTYALTRNREARAAVPEGVDPELWNMLLNLIEAVSLQTASIDNLVQTLGGAPVAGEDPFENAPRFVSGQVICTIINQAFQLPSFPIPKNKQLVVKALPGNVGWVVVGATQSDSQNIFVAYPLVPNEGIGLFVKNSSAVWVMAPLPPMGALNDGVAFLVETG